MARVFICYRRSETAAMAGRVHDHLRLRLGDDGVFKDVYSMTAGRDFREHVRHALARSDVVLLFIGSEWLHATDKSERRRLDNPEDLVRQEAEQALELGIPVIPVLVEDVEMPEADELPPSLQRVAYLHGTRLRDADFDYDLGRLCDAIAEVCGTVDDRGSRRRYLFLAGGVALVIAVAAVALGVQHLLGGADDTDPQDVAALQQRLEAMEAQAKRLESQLLVLSGSDRRGSLVPLVREELATGAAGETFTPRFRAEVDEILNDRALGDDAKADRLTPAITGEFRDFDAQIERQAQLVNSLQESGSPEVDVETLKLKRMIDRRSQMFGMLRQIIDRYNQTAKGIIDSIGR